MKFRAEHERDDTRRVEAAMDWLLRLRDELTSEDDILRWLKWCEADPRNQQAFDRVEELWALSGRLEQEVADGDLAGASDSPVWSRRESVAADSSVTSAWSALVRGLGGNGRRLAIGAAIAAVAIVSSLPLLRANLGPLIVGSRAVVARTPAKQLVREARLEDGTLVQLAAKSAVSVNYSPEERALDLKSGEAFFDVAPNKDRPFVVAAGPVRIRAVGTAFNVRRAADRVVVTVTEGQVEVSRTYDPAERLADADRSEYPGGVTISAGGQVRWDGADANPVLVSVDPSTALGWREGRLTYTDEPLASVIADLNRYSAQPVVLRGEELESLRFSGTLLTSETAEWLRALPRSLPVRIEAEDDTFVIRSRMSSGRAG